MNFVHDILAELLAFHGPSLLPWLSKRERLAAHMAVSPRGERQGLKEYLAEWVNQRRDYAVEDGIAIIHVNDALSRNTTGVDRALGMTDYSHLIGEFEQAGTDPEVRGALVDMNSPGGSAVGAPEAAAGLAALAAVKPVVSFVETMSASAAYYLGAASSAIVAGQSAIVGSIGTICSFLDFAGLLDRIGITAHIFTPAAADLKAVGTPYRPPTLAEANFLQARTEAINAGFTAWVSQFRPGVTAEAMRGQYFTGAQAQTLGLVDQIGTRADAFAAVKALAGL